MIISSFAFVAAFLVLSFLGCAFFPHHLPAPLLYEMALFDLIVRDRLTFWFPSLNQSWWHEIAPGLYLGGIPLLGNGHLKQIQSMNVKAVLAILEENEANAETFFTTSLKENDWKGAGIEYRRLSCPDMHAMSISEMEEAIEWIQGKIREGKPVYVHCKAGRGRSAMIVIGFLIRYYGMNFPKALKFLANKRSVIRFRPCQIERMEEFDRCLPARFTQQHQA